MEALVINPNLTLPAHYLSWKAVRSGGPGGQNVNKVASKVELRFSIDEAVELDGYTRRRLKTLHKNNLDKDDCLLVVSQKTRDQSRNLEDAREKLIEWIQEAMVRPKIRRDTKPTYGSVQRRLTEKKANSDKKKSRNDKDF